LSGEDVPADPNCAGDLGKGRLYESNKFEWEKDGSEKKQETFNLIDMLIRDFAYR